MTTMSLAERINPRNLGYSAKMTAIVGAILGHDYGVRDRRGNRLTGLSITSDGFVIAHTEPVSSGAFIGSADELEINIKRLLADANLTDEEAHEWELAYNRVTDWRD